MSQIKHIVLPTHDNILVQRIAPVTEVNGIVVPEASLDRPSEGHIVALGPQVMTSARRTASIEEDLNFCRRVELAGDYYTQTFDLGDHVMFGRFAGIEIEVDDQKFVKLKTDEIYVVIRQVQPESEPQPSDEKETQ